MEPRKLARALVERGLVEKFVIDQLLSKLAPKETLADRVVADGLVPENDLLHLIAEESKTRFVSTRKLEELRLSASLMEFIPPEAAEQHTALPLAWEAASKTLSIVMGDLSRQPKLDDLPRFAHVQRVNAYVGMPAAIRAAVRRLYFGEKDKAAAPPLKTVKCPQCSMAVLEDQLECGTCGLLLNPDAPTDGTEARIVRALLSEPTGVRRVPSRFQVHEGPTRLGFAIQVTDGLVPELSAGMEIVRSLSEFEAFVISFIDGQLTVDKLAQATNLVPVEVTSVLASLAERKVLRLKDPTRPEPEPEPEPEPAPPPPPPAKARPAAGAKTPGEGKAAAQPKPATGARPAVEAKPPAEAVPAPAASPQPATPATRTAEPPPRFPGGREPVVSSLGRPPTRPVEAVSPAGTPAAGAPARAPAAKPRHLSPEAQMENSIQSALALERRGEVDGAITVLKIAISRSPQPAPLYNRLALVLLHQRKDARAAEELIGKAIELEPDNTVYRENLARVFAFAASRRG